MPALATTPADQTIPQGGVWRIGVAATDLYDRPVSVTVSAVVTNPAGGTVVPTFTTLAVGGYLAEQTVATVGRWVAVVTVAGATSEVITYEAFVVATTTAAGMPALADLQAYLGDDATRWTTTDLTNVLAAETAAQRAVCRIRAEFTADLREALLRRCARNLAARAVPVTTYTAFDGGVSSTRVPLSDPEIQRLEGPYRRRRVG